MIFATILTLCTTVTAPCNEYIIDTANTSQDAAINKTIHSSDMHRVWKDATLLQAHLAKFNIGEDVSDVQSYEVSSQIIEDEMIP